MTDEPQQNRDVSEPGDEAEGIARLSYEQARDELMSVLQRLEAGGVTLEESLSLWERGEQLAERCKELLGNARARLDAALAAEEGSADGQ
ncbi:MAG TPA: exodeoxyribonuclease VII small subunit [Actinomycetales bacterium]|nr:exodeoxyribonuclease VII small subunit [Actinomycetales bacterium]